MVRLSLDSLAKTYGSRNLFSGLSLELQSSRRLVVLGKNGTGKSTLLRIIAGQSEPDQGLVRLDPPGAGLSFSSQELENQELQAGLLQWVLQGIPDWEEIWSKWGQALESGQEQAWKALAEQQSALELNFGFNPEHKAKKILAGLGFSQKQYALPLQTLSGGWRERAKLARVLVQGSQVLLLDEPTNHLDLEAVRWLEDFLLRFAGIVVFVAHDRFFLEKVANAVLHLAPEGPVYKELGFSQYQKWRAQKEEARLKSQVKLQKEIEHKQSFVDRFRYKASKAAQAQSRLKQIQGLEQKIQKFQDPEEGAALGFSWPEPARSNKLVLQARDLQFSYTPGEALWPGLNFDLCRGQKVALLGPNGAGKSSLLKLASGELFPSAGSIKLGSLVRPAFFHQHVAHVLQEKNTVLQEIQRLGSPELKQEEFCFALGLFHLGQDYWQRRVYTLSGGEKNRLILASVFLGRANFLLLDEPTNHLDLESRQALIRALQEYSGALLLVSHDRYLLSLVAESVWVLSSLGLEQMDTGFADYMAEQEAVHYAKNESASIPDTSRGDYKRQKRWQAQRRTSLYRALQPCRQEYSDLETQLEDCLQRQQELESALARPDTYHKGHRVQELQKSYFGLQQETEEIMRRMEELEEKMQDLQARA